MEIIKEPYNFFVLPKIFRKLERTNLLINENYTYFPSVFGYFTISSQTLSSFFNFFVIFTSKVIQNRVGLHKFSLRQGMLKIVSSSLHLYKSTVQGSWDAGISDRRETDASRFVSCPPNIQAAVNTLRFELTQIPPWFSIPPYSR